MPPRRDFSTHAYHFERAYPFTVVKFTVKYGALRFRVRGVFGMYVGTGPGALANLICGPRMISVRDENTAHTPADEFAEHIIVRLDWVDTQVSGWIGNQQAVEVVAMRLRKP